MFGGGGNTHAEHRAKSELNFCSVLRMGISPTTGSNIMQKEEQQAVLFIAIFDLY
jgi:hypothetical protein